MNRSLVVAGVVAATWAATAFTGAGPALAAAGPPPAGVDSHHASAGQSATRAAGVSARSAGEADGPDVHRSPGLKELLSQKDTDRAGDNPALSASCQKGIGQPNPYGSLSPNVDQISGDSIVPVGSQTGCSTAQNENTIAVNPENPNNIVAGANDYRVFNTREQRNDSSGFAYTSFDGGKTWKDIELPHLTFQTGGTGAFAQFDGAGDPIVAFGPHNTVYYGNIVFSRGLPTGNGTEAANGIALNVSHDGGLHWSEPILVQADGVTPTGRLTPSRIFNDKIWLAADPSNGRVYITWTRFADTADGGYLESPIVIKASSNYGRSFGARRRVDPTLANFKPGGITPFSQGSNPRVASDGTLYLAYEGEVCGTLACANFGTTDHDVTVIATSHDHGATFTRHVIGINYDFPFSDPLGTSVVTNENFRVNSFPQLAIDPITGLMGVTWSDDRNGRYDAKTGASIKSNGDNIVSLSRDGKAWTAPVAVGTGQDEFFAAIAISHGIVAITSYTRHYATNGINLDYAYWSSRDWARSGSLPVHRITTRASNPRGQFVGLDDDGKVRQGEFIGDYTAVAFGSDGELHPCWTDFRGNPGVTKPNQDADTQAIRI